MRQLSTVEINRIKLLTEKSIELCLIEPTRTGLEKSIMDATGSVRSYLKSSNIHDFELQTQGQENKIQITSFFISSNVLIDSVTSLYRPSTKKGDPRIWFKGLGGYANANDILGIIAFESNLYVLNITQLDLQKLIESRISNPLRDLVNEINKISNQVADELLILLNQIASRGPIPSMLQADTAIGRTLETLLGIDINYFKFHHSSWWSWRLLRASSIRKYNYCVIVFTMINNIFLTVDLHLHVHLNMVIPSPEFLNGISAGLTYIHRI